MAEFRSEVQPLVRPFRTEMVRLTSDLQGAFASGATDAELQALCRAIVDSKVGPALADLSKRLRNPVRPFHRVLVDIAEAGMAAASSTVSPALTVGWALIRGAKIASEYAQAYRDREGKRKSGLAYLLAVSDAYGADAGAISDWDKINWHCSGFVDIPDSGTPLTAGNQAMAEGPMKDWCVRVVRKLFQARTISAAQFFPHGKD